MIKFLDASTLQKKIVINIIKKLLSSLRANNHYRIQYDSSRLIIRERTSNPPPVELQQYVLTLMNSLNPSLFVSKADLFPYAGRSHQFFLIESINNDFINKMMGKNNQSIVRKPNDVDEYIWAHLPKEITSNWTQFSNELQEHIINCFEADLPKKLAQVSEQKYVNLGDTFISPISLDFPAFPVRLRAPKGKANDVKADVNKVYDLLEILKIKQHSSENGNVKRHHPLTREEFSLNDILPAQDALEKISNRATKAMMTTFLKSNATNTPAKQNDDHIEIQCVKDPNARPSIQKTDTNSNHISFESLRSSLDSYITKHNNYITKENIFISFFRGAVGFSRVVKRNSAQNLLNFLNYMEKVSLNQDLEKQKDNILIKLLNNFTVQEILALRQGDLGKIFNDYKKYSKTKAESLKPIIEKFEEHENYLLKGITNRCVAISHR